jgi:hypothetical protein
MRGLESLWGRVDGRCQVAVLAAVPLLLQSHITHQNAEQAYYMCTWEVTYKYPRASLWLIPS